MERKKEGKKLVERNSLFEDEETKLNAFGELTEESAEKSAEIYNLIGPNGEQTPIKLGIKPIYASFVDESIKYLTKKGDLRIPRNNRAKVEFREAEIPYLKKEEAIHLYGGVKVSLGKNKEMILIDSRLKLDEQIAIIFHELIHARGYDSSPGIHQTEKEKDEMEKKVQLETIQGLKRFYEEFEEIKKYYDEKGLHEEAMEYIKPRNLRGAVNYALATKKHFDVSLSDVKHRIRKGKSGLEDKVELTLFVLVAIAALYFTDNIKQTGFALLLNHGVNIALGSIIWLALFVFTLVLAYLKVRRIRASLRK